MLTPLVYLATWFAYWMASGACEKNLPRFAPIATAITALVIHSALLFVRGKILGQAPWTTHYEMLSVMALVMTVTYVVVEALSKEQGTGFDFMWVPFVLVVYAYVAGPHDPKGNPILDSPFFIMHTVPAITGMSAIVVAGLYGVLYIRLENAIRAKRFGGLYKRMPNLEMLSRMNYVSSLVGLILVTAAIGYGASWYGEVFDRVNLLEPKITLTLLMWVILLVPVFGRGFRRWSDRSTAIISVVAMALIVVSITITMLPFVDFHGHR